MNLGFEANDFPQYGVTLITPSNPAFEIEASSMLQGKENELKQLIEAVKPFSVFVRNQGDLSVVGCSLQWSITNIDGTVARDGQSYSSPGVLMGMEPADKAMVGHTALINPHTNRFMSLDLAVKQVLDAATNSLRPSRGLTTDEKQEIKRHTAYLRELYGGMTRSAASISVSLDGVVLSDGTFFGPDKNQLILNTQAMVEANRELAKSIERYIKEKTSPADIFKGIKSLVTEPELTEPSSVSSASNDYRRLYLRYMQLSIDELIRIREASGETQALKYSQEPLRKPWPQLRPRTES